MLNKCSYKIKQHLLKVFICASFCVLRSVGHTSTRPQSISVEKARINGLNSPSVPCTAGTVLQYL